jgi:hypothetical protein
MRAHILTRVSNPPMISARLPENYVKAAALLAAALVAVKEVEAGNKDAERLVATLQHDLEFETVEEALLCYVRCLC